MSFLLRLQYLINVLIQILACLYRGCQIQHRLSSNQCLLMVILDFYVDDMHRPVEIASTIQKIITYSVKTTLLARDYHIRYGSAILPALWSELYFAVAI